MSTLHTCSKDDHSSDFAEKQILIVKVRLMYYYSEQMRSGQQMEHFL